MGLSCPTAKDLRRGLGYLGARDGPDAVEPPRPLEREVDPLDNIDLTPPATRLPT